MANIPEHWRELRKAQECFSTGITAIDSQLRTHIIWVTCYLHIPGIKRVFFQQSILSQMELLHTAALEPGVQFMGASVVSLDTAVFSHASLKVPPLHPPHGCRL